MTQREDYQIIAWQRFEGLLMLLAALVYFEINGASWWWFSLVLAPDVSMVGYLANKRVGAFCYNLGHSLVLPLFGLAAAAYSQTGWLTILSLIWLAHIGLDRMLGYGLKYSDNFKHTHLGSIGRS